MFCIALLMILFWINAAWCFVTLFRRGVRFNFRRAEAGPWSFGAALILVGLLGMFVSYAMLCVALKSNDAVASFALGFACALAALSVLSVATVFLFSNRGVWVRVLQYVQLGFAIFFGLVGLGLGVVGENLLSSFGSFFMLMMWLMIFQGLYSLFGLQQFRFLAKIDREIKQSAKPVPVHD